MPFDRKAIGKKVRAQVFGHWSVLVPLVGAGGFTSYGMFIASDWGLPLFGIIAATCISAGSYLYRFMYKQEEITKSEIEKARAKFEAERNVIADTRERELDDFHRLLASDDHTTDENLLYDLRSIAGTFRSDRTWVENIEPQDVSIILARVDTVFEACLEKLKRSFNQRQRADNIRGEGKQDLLETSQAILDEVQADIEELGKIFAKINKHSIRRATGATLDQADAANNLKELRDMISLAERSEDARQQLLSGTSGDDQRYAEYLNADKPT